MQWNPADERYMAVEVQVRTLERLEGFAVRGELSTAVEQLQFDGEGVER